MLNDTENKYSHVILEYTLINLIRPICMNFADQIWEVFQEKKLL